MDAVRGVCAIVATFRPDAARLAEVLAALEGAVDATILVDDASPDWDPTSLTRTWPALTVERLPINAGIAAAQNRGIRLAKARSASHVLLLDQDSVPQPGMVRVLFDALGRDAGRRVACAGSRHRLPGSDRLSAFETIGWLGVKHATCGDARSTVECDTVISSGALMPVQALDEIGGMDESLFIDLVDIDWCLRAKSMGWRIVGACGAVLEHRLGESTRRVWAGRWRRVPRHKAFRYYYIFRNTLLLARRRYVPLKWVLYYLRRLAALFLVQGLLARDRQGEIAMMAKGLMHGMRGTSGKMDDR
jgi:rhamnosyltransferase